MSNKKIEEGSVVLCTVEKISGTTVFLKIEDNVVGTMITSEVAPGRIRNLRDYVFPNKRVVCKVLEIDINNNIHLSLRRVTVKEKRDVLDKYNKEKSFEGILKTVVKEPESVWKKLKQKEDVVTFFETAKENPKILANYFTKDESEKISKILKDRKEKEVLIKSGFKLISKTKDGIETTKKILLPYKENITYIAAGKFQIKLSATDYKKANLTLNKILEEIHKKAKEEKAEFEFLDK